MHILLFLHLVGPVSGNPKLSHNISSAPGHNQVVPDSIAGVIALAHCLKSDVL